MLSTIGALESHLADAFSGIEFDDPSGPIGAVKEMTVYTGALPQKTVPDEKQQPFSVLAASSYAAQPKTPSTINIRVDLSVYTLTDVTRGLVQLNEIVSAVNSMLRGNRTYSGARLMRIDWAFGDGTNAQPHPFYYATAMFEFIKL